MKEMTWMSEDFSAERKRHIGASKKRSRAVVSHFASFEKKAIRKKKEEQVSAWGGKGGKGTRP